MEKQHLCSRCGILFIVSLDLDCKKVGILLTVRIKVLRCNSSQLRRNAPWEIVFQEPYTIDSHNKSKVSPFYYNALLTRNLQS